MDGYQERMPSMPRAFATFIIYDTMYVVVGPYDSSSANMREDEFGFTLTQGESHIIMDNRASAWNKLYE